MKKLYIWGIVLALIFTCGCTTTQQKPSKHRKLALHSYVYRKVATIEDVVSEAKQLGVEGVALSQTIKFKKYPNVRITPDINSEQRAYLKKIFTDANVEIVAFGIGSGFKTPEDADKYLSFCKDMGIKIFVWEGNYKDIPFIDKKAKEYGVKIAVHHHTAKYNKDNKYNTPEGMLSRVKDYENVGALADNGHWAREKTDAIKGYKLLKNEILQLHFKDPRQFGAEGKTDAPIGEGCLDIPALLKALDEIGFDGYFVLENETVSDNPTPAMKKSVEYLRNH